MKNRKPINVAVIGLGQIGKQHIEKYLEMENVNVFAVAGNHESQTEFTARKYKIGKWTCDYKTLLQDPKIDAVSVCLHNYLHSPVSIDALNCGKHVYCEKPIANTYEEGQKMLEAAKRNDRLLSVQLFTLFSQETKAAKHAIDQGWLGEPYHAHSVNIRRKGRPFVDGYGSKPFVQKQKAGGGALLDVGVYYISQILYLLDNPDPIKMSGKTYQKIPMNPGRQIESGYDVEELALGVVRFEGDLTITLLHSWALHLDDAGGSYIVGSLGGIRLQPFGLFRNLGELSINATANLEDFEFRLNTIFGQNDNFDTPQKHFIAAIRGEAEVIPSAQIALNAMLISEGIYLSNQLGREVSVAEIC